MPRASSPTSRIFQVFLASPGDVLKERKYVEDVIAELNRTIAREKSIVIQTRRWELDTFPQAGSDVQKLINSQIADMASCKLFVGIMWNRCGTKTRRALSGTVEEYDRALKAKEKHKQPEIWFYFKEPKIVRPTNDQLHQLEQVNLFRGKVQSECLAFTFKTPSNFKDLFRNHLTLWLGKLQNAEIQRKEQKCRLNPYKLYYFRQTRKLSYTSLANATGVDRNSLRRMENIAPTQSAKLLSAEEFPEIDISTLATIERALDCHGKLSGGQADDFLSQYLLFYDTYKSISRKGGRKSPDTKQQDLRFRTQAVVFDFGGTLTETQGKHTTWERLWQKLGYSVNDCSELHRRYQRGLLTHQEWCDLTCAAFRKRGLSDRHLQELAQQVRLVPGVASTIMGLRERGIKLYIVSGSLKPLIIETLGSLHKEFEEVRANDVSFDTNGIISRIQSTPYDFRGKAEFLRRVIKELKVSPLDVLFVGNSCNDVFASESGVRTLCVNPRFTDPDKPEHWTYAIREMVDLSMILQYVYL